MLRDGLTFDSLFAFVRSYIIRECLRLISTWSLKRKVPRAPRMQACILPLNNPTMTKLSPISMTLQPSPITAKQQHKSTLPLRAFCDPLIQTSKSRHKPRPHTPLPNVSHNLRHTHAHTPHLANPHPTPPVLPPPPPASSIPQ